MDPNAAFVLVLVPEFLALKVMRSGAIWKTFVCAAQEDNEARGTQEWGGGVGRVGGEAQHHELRLGVGVGVGAGVIVVLAAVGGVGVGVGEGGVGGVGVGGGHEAREEQMRVGIARGRHREVEQHFNRPRQRFHWSHRHP
jgi:hypothetical protein